MVGRFEHLAPPHNWAASSTASHVHHRPWTEAEVTKLIALHRGGGTTDEIAEAVHHPRGSVANKVAELQHAGMLTRRMRSVRRAAPPKL